MFKSFFADNFEDPERNNIRFDKTKGLQKLASQLYGCDHEKLVNGMARTEANTEAVAEAKRHAAMAARERKDEKVTMARIENMQAVEMAVKGHFCDGDR